MKVYIARFGHGSAKLARQAQSKEKTLAKMERGGLTEKVVRDRILVFRFTNVGKLPPPVLQFVEVTHRIIFYTRSLTLVLIWTLESHWLVPMEQGRAPF